jgi:hypothetical protein
MSYITTELTKAGFISIGSACADIDGQRDEALLSFYNAVLVEGDIDYSAWVDGATFWKQGYAEAKRCQPDDNKVSVAWHSFTTDLKTQYDIVKPAKPSKVGQDKAKQRTKQAEEMEAIKAKPIEELVEEVAMLTQNPTLANIQKATKIQKAVEAKRKEAVKDRMAGITELQKDVKALVGQCLDEEKLGYIKMMLEGEVDISIM